MDSIAKALEKVPAKTYYRIGEVARYTGLKPYVLRFWETEFKAMMPPKSRSKQRMYRRKDIETILTIKHLLYKERFTIAGARRRLADLTREARDPEAVIETPRHALDVIRQELVELRELLAAS